MLTYLEANTAKSGVKKHAILFLHAFPLSAAMWKPQIEALGAAGYTVIAPNSFGIDGSPEQEGWTFTDYAHELATLLDSLQVEKTTVVGLSMGGYQAFEFYRLYPEKIASLVLCDTRAEADAPAARSARADFISAVEMKGAKEAAGRMIPNYFSAGTDTIRPELVAQAEEMITKQSPAVINGAMRAIMARFDATSLLDAITCPVLVLNGEEDRLTTKETAESIHAHIPGSQLRLLARAGHISNMEQPEAFNRALLEHLSSLPDFQAVQKS
ncbi:MAG: alpha/beta fold hydrolase [Chlorobium sp.]|nr:MAG: alpha/beta fold hydrolase [Chlorobium sp.]